MLLPPWVCRPTLCISPPLPAATQPSIGLPRGWPLRRRNRRPTTCMQRAIRTPLTTLSSWPAVVVAPWTRRTPHQLAADRWPPGREAHGPLSPTEPPAATFGGGDCTYHPIYMFPPGNPLDKRPWSSWHTTPPPRGTFRVSLVGTDPAPPEPQPILKPWAAGRHRRRAAASSRVLEAAIPHAGPLRLPRSSLQQWRTARPISQPASQSPLSSPHTYSGSRAVKICVGVGVAGGSPVSRNRTLRSLPVCAVG